MDMLKKTETTLADNNYVSFNHYARENVILGLINQAEPVPFDLYVSELGLPIASPFNISDSIEGFTIDAKGFIKERPLEEYYWDFFADQVNVLFASAPKFSPRLRKDGLYDFKFGLCEYLTDVFGLFKKIIAQIIYTDYVAEDGAIDANIFYEQKFVKSVLLRKLRYGSRIDRYIKVSVFPNNYVSKLIKSRGKHNYLINSNPDNIDYKLALLSTFIFETKQHKRIFINKIVNWEHSDRNNPSGV